MTLVYARTFQKSCKSSPRQFFTHFGKCSSVDCVLVCSDPRSDPPAWERLISHTLSTHERISLIVSIFSDRNEIEMVGHLSGDDAQAFIDVIDEVSNAPSPPKNGSVDSH
jgi:hypothetical protein